MIMRQKPTTLASELAKKELADRLTMNVKGDPNDPLAAAVNEKIPMRIVRDEKGVQSMIPNSKRGTK